MSAWHTLSEFPLQTKAASSLCIGRSQVLQLIGDSGRGFPTRGDEPKQKPTSVRRQFDVAADLQDTGCILHDAPNRLALSFQGSAIISQCRRRKRPNDEIGNIDYTGRRDRHSILQNDAFHLQPDVTVETTYGDKALQRTDGQFGRDIRQANGTADAYSDICIYKARDRLSRNPESGLSPEQGKGSEAPAEVSQVDSTDCAFTGLSAPHRSGDARHRDGR